MFYQIEQVLDLYGLTDARTYKGRGVLICEKNQELWALKEFRGSLEQAEFWCELGRYLQEEGLPCDCIQKTLDGALTAEGPDGIRYTLHQWFRGRECDVKNRMDILMSVSHLARFHSTVRGFGASQSAPLQQGEQILSLYQRHNRELIKIRNYVRKRRQKNDFERLFSGCFGEFYEQCVTVEQALKQAEEAEVKGKTGICHGDFNQHNILLSANTPALIHFEKAKAGTQMTDLGNFMRKIMEKYSWEEGLGMAMIQEYDRVDPMSREDLLELYYRLAYPEKFWKIANHYYGSNKVWISGRNTEKLQKEIRQHRARCEYLKRLLEEVQRREY